MPNETRSEDGEPAATSAEAIAVDTVARCAQRLYEQGHLEAARQLALLVATHRQDHVPVLLTLGHVLRELGQFDDALRILERIGELSPNHVNAHAAYALTLFFKEDWEKAWRAFDVRFKFPDAVPTVTMRRPDGTRFAAAPWSGGPPPASLLVIGEQGLGDTIQFARFLPQLAATGTKATCVVPRSLLRLLGTLGANVTFAAMQEGGGSATGVSAWTPLLHLPRALGLGPESFVPRMPYLAAEPDRIARWREWIGPDGFKVGIAWQGNPDPRVDLGRSVPLAAFAPLAEIPNVRLISLQKGHGEEQIASVPFAARIERLGEDFDAGPDAFIDTAAAMQSLDLVVSVDTSVAHLAGALGRPVFILLKCIGAHWAWLHRREDSVWYPSARLFRQRMPNDWAELMDRVAREVGARAAVQSAGSAASAPTIPVPAGELVDKLTILEIKSERIGDMAKRANVLRERAALEAAAQRLAPQDGGLEALRGRLKAINGALWDIEDAIRDCERRKDFGPRFVELARSVYTTNDARARLKREIDGLCGSLLVEEKEYAAY